MTALADVIGGAGIAAGGLTATIPEDWMQGRTCYGGLSTALAFQAARSAAEDLPPLRTAQVSFVGPLAGEVSVQAALLRRGRNAAYVRADVHGEAGLGLSAIFVFMRPFASAIDHSDMRAPEGVPPEGDMIVSGPRSFFARNLEFDAASRVRLWGSDLVRWTRFKERDGLDPMLELVAVADALPPAAVGLSPLNGPISSMTWTLNLLTPEPSTRDGWWRLRSTAEHARDGCSSQTMAIWNADGQPVATGMQSVALFV